MRNLRGHGFFGACGGRGRGATRPRRNFDGAPRRRSTRRGPGGRGGLLEALRGCPPSARPPRPASAARQPNVNLGATRARTRPATRRAPLRPVWRHGRRWRGERRPSWCYRFAARAQSNMQIARTKPTSVPRGVRASRSVSRERAEGSLRRDRWAFPPKLHIRTRARAAVDVPEASRRGTRRQENSETRHMSYHTTRTTKRGRAGRAPDSRISAARKPSPRSRAWTRGTPSRGRRRSPSALRKRGASPHIRVKPR